MLMNSLQVLHNNAAKIVVNRPVHSSSTEALIDLRWINLRVRQRVHRLVHIFTCIKVLTLQTTFFLIICLSRKTSQNSRPSNLQYISL